MKEETVLDVLMYLFHHYMHNNCRIDMIPEELCTDLAHAGFPQDSIDYAIDWLDSLTDDHWLALGLTAQTTIRVFTPHECEFLNVRARGFLLTMLQEGILTATTCEIVIEHVLQLRTEGIDLSLLKWVILMVLFNQPEQEEALRRMEFLIVDDVIGGIH